MDKLLCASMMCADFAKLEAEIDELTASGVDLLHIDIMDGSFVPNFGMGLQDTQLIADRANIPVDVHLMIQNPGNYVEQFASMGCDIIYIHAEADVHAPRTLQKIINAGAKAGIAINPGTAIESIEPYISMVEYILVMTVNPGFAGQKYLDFVDKKIDKLLQLKDEHDFKIVIDGACSPQKIAQLSSKGVEGFILGTSALFGKNRPYSQLIQELREI